MSTRGNDVMNSKANGPPEKCLGTTGCRPLFAGDFPANGAPHFILQHVICTMLCAYRAGGEGVWPPTLPKQNQFSKIEKGAEHYKQQVR